MSEQMQIKEGGLPLKNQRKPAQKKAAGKIAGRPGIEC